MPTQLIVAALLAGVVGGSLLHLPVPVAAALGATALAAAAFSLRGHRGSGVPDACEDELERHVASLRRRGAQGDVLVVRIPAGTDAGRVRTAFRLTDSVTVVRRNDSDEIHAVLDRERLSRAGVERRLREVAGVDLGFGWAGFPERGVTLTALIHEAACSLTPACSERPRGRFVPGARLAPELSYETGGLK